MKIGAVQDILFLRISWTVKNQEVGTICHHCKWA